MNWTRVAPGVWRAVFGQAEAFTPLAAVGGEPRLKGLRALGEGDLPFHADAVKAHTLSHRTVVEFPLDEGEKIYGLGLQFFKINHRGRTRYLRVNSDPAQDTGETHAPVPFYVSSKGYGVLVNTARIVTIYCGSCARKDSRRPPVMRDRISDPDWRPTPTHDAVEIVVNGDGLEILVFAGQSPLEAVRRYVLFCGGGCLPPRWGLGFWHRVPMTFTSDQVMEEALEFRRRGVPCDVIGLEPGWHSRSYPCTFKWDSTRFPNPSPFVTAMRSRGFHVNLWEHPYVHPESPLHSDLEKWSGSHTVWGGLAPDLTLPQVQETIQNQHGRDHVDLGVSGYKLDECDGSELTACSWMFPGHATFPSGLDGEQMRQVYGLMFQKLTYEMFRRRNRRTYGLVRASMTGSPPMPYVLYSDLYDHRQFVRALCNSGFSGLLWCPEVRDAGDVENWVRRMQVLCFSPLMMLNAWSSGTKPWSLPEAEPIIRKYLQLRMRLIPYFYTAFARYHFEGVPPFRAMALEEPLPAMDQDIDDQYLAGDSLLVAPVFAGEKYRDVFLPEGDWYDFQTAEKFTGGQKIRVYPGLDTISVFVRDGGIIPMMAALDHVPQAGEKIPLEVRHYGGKPGTFLLYDDDGETFAYEKGQFRWLKLEATVSSDGQRRGSHSAVEGSYPGSYDPIEWKFLGSSP